MTELSEVMLVFQDYLNEMFTGINCLSASETRINSTSANIEYILPESHNISILEKINRIPELHDPELIDIEHIQYLTSMLGYNVNLNRGELGTYLVDTDNVLSAASMNSYLRFIVLSLPHWYKVKTTEASIKLLLYTFGIVADISYYYTDSYLPESQGGKWRVSDYDMIYDSISEIPNNFYPTPHFIIWQDLDLSNSELQWDIERRTSILNAINSIRPINTVFRHIGAYTKKELNVGVSGHVRWKYYCKIGAEGNSDHWVL